eukprot:UN05712
MTTTKERRNYLHFANPSRLLMINRVVLFIGNTMIKQIIISMPMRISILIILRKMICWLFSWAMMAFYMRSGMAFLSQVTSIKIRLSLNSNTVSSTYRMAAKLKSSMI